MATVRFAITNDNTDEAHALAATATIGADTGYNIGTASATAEVRDDDVPALTIAAANSPATEGDDANISFTITSTLDAPTGGLPVTVTLTSADTFVAATARTQTATITAGARTTTANFPITDDNADEPHATAATATIGASDDYTIATATARAEIRDDDVPMLTIAAANSPVTEADGAALAFTVTTSIAAPAGGFTATVTLTGADNFVDAAARTTTATILQNETTTRVTFAITNDEIDEANADAATATLSAPTGGAELGTPVTATAQIIDDDTPMLTIVATTASVTEADGAALTFTINSTLAAPLGGLPITITLSGANDFVVASEREQRVTIPEGARTVRVIFPVHNDNEIEEPATVTATATLASSTRYNGGGGAARVQVVDDDQEGDARLGALALAGALLQETFARETLAYTARFSRSATAVTVTATPNNARAACAIGGETCAPGGNTIALSEAAREGEADDVVTITVTSADGTMTATYTITLSVGVLPPPEVVQELGTVSVGAIDRSVAQQSIGLIAQRFSGSIVGAPGATPGSPDAPGSSDGSSELVRSLKLAFNPNAPRTRNFATDDAKNLAHTAAAPGSLEARYSDDNNWRRLRSDDLNPRTLLEKNPLAFNIGAGEGYGVWLAATHSTISGTPKSAATITDYDGTTNTLQAGVDQRFNDGTLLLGVALGWNTSEVDFTQTNAALVTTAADAARGEIKRTGVVLHPYLSWRASPRTSLWLLGGYGTGAYKVTLRDGDSADRADTDATQWLLAGGAEGSLLQREGFEVLSRAGAFFSRSVVDAGAFAGSGENILAFASNSWQVQGEVEAAREAPCRACSLRYYALGLARAQGGDGTNSGAALGLGAGVKADFNELGLNFDLGARAEAAETDDQRTSTFYGALRYDIDGDGRGVVANLEHGMSQVLQSSWRTGAFDDGGGVGELNAASGVQANFGYGWGARMAGRAGTLTAFTELQRSGAGTAQSIGLRFLSEAFEMRLETQARESEVRTQFKVQSKF